MENIHTLSDPVIPEEKEFELAGLEFIALLNAAPPEQVPAYLRLLHSGGGWRGSQVLPSEIMKAFFGLTSSSSSSSSTISISISLSWSLKDHD